MRAEKRRRNELEPSRRGTGRPRTPAGAGGNRRPDAFAPAAASFAPRSLSNVAVNHHETHGLFRQIVRGFDAGRGNEAEIGFSVLVESFGHVSSVLRVRHAARGRPQHLPAGRFQCLPKTRPGHRPAAVDHGKQFPQRVPQPLAISLILTAGQRQKEFHVADQMCHAELHQHVKLPHVLAVGAEVIAAQHAVELLAQHRHQHFRAARLVDAEERIKPGRKHHVQNRSPFSLCPVSSMFSVASPGSRSNNSAYDWANDSLTLAISLAR